MVGQLIGPKVKKNRRRKIESLSGLVYSSEICSSREPVLPPANDEKARAESAVNKENEFFQSEQSFIDNLFTSQNDKLYYATSPLGGSGTI